MKPGASEAEKKVPGQDTSAYIKAFDDAKEDFARLGGLMALLRGENGCPWDREQTYASIKICLLEETYEIFEALDDNDAAGLCEELGDLLFVIIFYYQLALEKNDFSVAQSLAAIHDKITNRHPHVFADLNLETSAQVLANWEKIKKKEKKERVSALDGVPRTLPALMKAQKVNQRADGVGFGWPDTMPMFEKLVEEVDELKAAIANGDKINQAEEVGDILFLITNIAHKLGVSAEESLASTIQKFNDRFRRMESELGGKENMIHLSMAEKEAAYQKAKTALAKSK